MTQVELLTVEERFQLERDGLVVVPTFAVPPGHWKNFKDIVLISRPDGTFLEAEASFDRTHFNIPDPDVAISKRWRVVLHLSGIVKDQVPIGSKIMVSPEVRARVAPAGEA